MNNYITLWSGKRLDATLIIQIHPSHSNIVFFHMSSLVDSYFCTGHFNHSPDLNNLSGHIEYIEDMYIKGAQAHRDILISEGATLQ